jgi:hypothetical protein
MLKKKEFFDCVPRTFAKVSVPFLFDGSGTAHSTDSIEIAARLLSATEDELVEARKLDALCGPLFYKSLKPDVYKESYAFIQNQSFEILNKEIS